MASVLAPGHPSRGRRGSIRAYRRCGTEGLEASALHNPLCNGSSSPALTARSPSDHPTVSPQRVPHITRRGLLRRCAHNKKGRPVRSAPSLAVQGRTMKATKGARSAFNADHTLPSRHRQILPRGVVGDMPARSRLPDPVTPDKSSPQRVHADVVSARLVQPAARPAHLSGTPAHRARGRFAHGDAPVVIQPVLYAGTVAPQGISTPRHPPALQPLQPPLCHVV